MKAFVALFFLALVVQFPADALAGSQIDQVQSVADMAGMRMTAGAMVGITAGGQFVTGVNRGPGGHIRNQAGFLTAMILQPDLDSDGDGVCNEMSIDNDSDGLEDNAEIQGTAFVPPTVTDPNDADTDNDEMRDLDESVAGTDPTLVGSVLEMAGFEVGDGGTWVMWKGGSSARQILMRRSSLTSPDEPWEPIFTNEPPTLTAVAVLDTSGTNRLYHYMIKAERP